ncbi:MAG: dockerin type I domain-containing protein [Bacillota bacterium]|nr:dockerin type I domain-containing protein [Bacillota bacterium]
MEKRIVKSLKLVVILALLLLFTSALSAISFADASPTPQLPAFDNDKFLFIDTHTNREGKGDVGPGIMIDFPTYSYFAANNSLRSYIQVPGYNASATKIIVGSGTSLSGTAGGGAATGLKAYDNFAVDGRFLVDSDLTVHFYMNNAWRVVRVGETWNETVEEKPYTGDGTFIVTYGITNYGLLGKSNLIQPTPIVTATNTPASTPTPVDTRKKYRVSGYIEPEPNLLDTNRSYAANFKVEIPEIGRSVLTDASGHFILDEIPQKTDGKDYVLKVSKAGYLTRAVSNFTADKDTEIGSTEQPIAIISGDINGDGSINMSDIIILAKTFNMTSSNEAFDKTADLNGDGAINMSDVMIIARHFNKSYSEYSSPSISHLNYINMRVNDSTDIILNEGGFSSVVGGLTWSYTISNNNIIKFISKTTATSPYPDAYNQSKWTFKAVSKGLEYIIFTPSYGIVEKYIIDITDAPTASPTATSLVTLSPTPTPVLVTFPTASPSRDPLVVDSKTLKSTLISTNPDQKIETGKNVVFCPTMLMAWDELKGVIGGNIKLQDNPPLADRLNTGFPMASSLSPLSYFARAGYGQSTIDKINSELKEKFGGSAPQVNLQIDPLDIISYAYLSKNLSFQKAFESFSEPVHFASSSVSDNVKAFGINSYSKKVNDLSKQVDIYDYKSKNDFIVKLKPQGDLDEIILAKVKPEESMFATYTSVMSRITNTRPSGFDPRDVLKVPVIDFNIGHHYTELEGKYLLNTGFESYFIDTAYQRTRFKLDENGAVLASEAILYLPASIYEPKQLIFDGPYMIILKEKSAANPYLMIWVDNPELLLCSN